MKKQILDLKLPPHEGMSLERAQQMVTVGANRQGGGVKCPCCNQNVKVYARKMNPNKCRFLIDLYRFRNVKHWVNYEECFYKGRDYSHVLLWKLAEMRQNHDSKKKDSGYWRITDDGVLFVEGELAIAEHAYTYNNVVLAYNEDSYVNIEQCLAGSDFDLQKLLNTPIRREP